VDYLLIFYCFLFILLCFIPFIFVSHQKDSDFTNDIELQIERKILLENLRDLKTDMETGKFSREELHLLANDITLKLQQIDAQIPQESDSFPICKSCQKEVPLLEAKYCPSCGTLI
jgi:RNA polymerase-binding transcription factor DksA